MDLESVRKTLSIAQSTGNVEQEILAGALLSRILLQIGEDDEAYNVFSRSMQIADQHELKFMAARLLIERAQFYFDKGDFLQAANYHALAATVSRAAETPWTTANCAILGTKLILRMGLVVQARQNIAGARDELRRFPNAALSAQITELEELAEHTRARPEGH